MISRKIGLYIHIPFCIQKCQYCDFLSFPAGEEEKEQYVKQLLIEMKVRSANLKECVVDTVFLGGGTPSILNEKQIEKIMQGIFANFTVSEDAEITILERTQEVSIANWIILAIFGVASYTDHLDGKIARKNNLITLKKNKKKQTKDKRLNCLLVHT